MSTYMHCRPCCGSNIRICSSSFLFVRPDYITTSNYPSYTPSSYHYHDQVPPPPPVIPRRRRRLEDPITTYASNYYSTFPRQLSQVPPLPLSQPPPLPPPRGICQQSNYNGGYCDLFNLLERPSSLSPPTLKQRRKYNSNDFSSHRHHRSTDFENVHTKSKNLNERKHHHQQPCYYKEKNRQNDRLSSTEQYDQSPEKTKRMNDIYQQRSSNKGFFRRVIRNYFCMPSTVANNGYSS